MGASECECLDNLLICRICNMVSKLLGSRRNQQVRLSIAIVAFALLVKTEFKQGCYAGWPAVSNLKGISVAEYPIEAKGISSQQIGLILNNSIAVQANAQSDLSATAYVGDIAFADQVIGGLGGACVPRSYGYPDLFYNYYTQGFCNASNAQMYLCPRPVPPFVGNTYFTYQPWYPEEMLYWHKNRYHNYYDGGRGMNHTRVFYMAPPIRTTWSNLYWNKIRIPR